jgi:hypothetical protein
MYRIFSSIAALALLLGANRAEAYLDPSTGSMLISAIVGIVASIGLAVKTYWYRLKALFRRNATPAERSIDDRTN